MILSTFVIRILVVMCWLDAVYGFNHIFSGSIKLTSAQKAKSNDFSIVKKRSSSRVFALNPGVLERIGEIRVQHAALDAKVKREKQTVIHDGEILSALETLGTIVESADALAQIDENLHILKEDLESPNPKNPELFSKMHASFMECKSDFESNLNQAVTNLQYDPKEFEPDVEEPLNEEADKD